MLNYEERAVGPFHCIQFEEDILEEHLSDIDMLFQEVMQKNHTRLILAFQNIESISMGFTIPYVRLKNAINARGGKLVLYEAPIEFEFILRVGRLTDNVELKVNDESSKEALGGRAHS